MPIIDLKKAIEIQPSNLKIYLKSVGVDRSQDGFALSEGHTVRELIVGAQVRAQPRMTHAGAIYEFVGNIAQAIDDYGRALSLDYLLSSSAQALKRLLAKKDIGSGGAGVSALSIP